MSEIQKAANEHLLALIALVAFVGAMVFHHFNPTEKISETLIWTTLFIFATTLGIKLPFGGGGSNGKATK